MTESSTIEAAGEAAGRAPAPLYELLPAPSQGGVLTDAILDRFLDYVANHLGLELYPAQEEAILELLAGKHVFLATSTGSGKSLVARALHFKALAENKISYYTSPVKALANEKFFELCDAFGPDNVGLLTGDASVNKGAPILCCTTEILANIGLRDPTAPVHYVVLDEFHFYADRDRGMAWHLPLITLRDTTFLLMSATLGHTAEIEERLAAFTGREVAAIHGTERPVPLEYEYRDTPIHETVESLLAANAAPIYLVNFTQRSCPEQAQALTSINLTDKEGKRAIAEAIGGFAFNTPSGKELSRFIRHGIGLHHAGLLPRYRRLIERLAQRGLLKVISGTDTLGVGVNIPIRTVLFTKLCKYDGEKTAILKARDFHQIAGRAGRKGFDEEGRVVVQAPEHVIENLRLIEKAVGRPEKKKKLVKRKPPDRGYAHWDENTFKTLLTKRPEPLEARFDAGWSMIVDLLREYGAGGFARLVEIVGLAHLSEKEKKRQRRLAAERFRSLRSLGVVEVSQGPRVRIDPELQDDFSIRHTLGLWLLDAVDLLDVDLESHALDLLTLVEATIENPEPILRRQRDQIFTERLAELKAQGMEYEERMAELEKIEHPKPLRELIYDSFNDFSEKHPWAGGTIRPKSVARDLVERCLGFNDYVSHLGLERVEGLLLRYLTDVYKAAVQSVPEAYRTDAFDDVVTYLRQVVRHTDASLLDEWEAMRGGERVLIRPGEIEPPRPPMRLAPDADPRVFAARIRSEMHRLLGALAARDYETAATLVRPEEEAWTAADFEVAVSRYFESHSMIELGPRARQPRNTVITGLSDRRYEVQQVIVDPSGEGDEAIRAMVDLSVPAEDPDAPLIAVFAIGP